MESKESSVTVTFFFCVMSFDYSTIKMDEVLHEIVAYAALHVGVVLSKS